MPDAPTTPGAPAPTTPVIPESVVLPSPTPAPPAAPAPSPATPAGAPAAPGPTAPTGDDSAEVEQAAESLSARLRAMAPPVRPPTPASPPPARQPAPPPPAPVAPRLPTDRFQLTPEGRAEVVRRYRAAPDDDQALAALVEEAVALGEERAVERVLSDPRLYARSTAHTLETVGERQRDAAVNAEISSFFETHVPDLPPETTWAFAGRAVAQHPNDLKAQVRYCVREARALVARIKGGGAAAAQSMQGLTRTQDGLVPGGGGARPSAAPGGAPAPTFLEQQAALFGGRTGA